MPSKHSGGDTKQAALVLADELGVTLQTIPIHDAVEREIKATVEMLGGKQPTELTRQNIQARIRGQRMWNWANSSGALFLQTGDMSEKAVGYTTIGGDLEGALSVIANVPKTVVIALLERLETRFGFKGVSATLHTDPGPELADKQVAENELMPFPVLDACLHLYAGEKMSPDEMGVALKALFPDHPPTSSRTGPSASRSSSPSRSTSGCSHRSRCTSARSISIASALFRCLWYRRTNGESKVPGVPRFQAVPRV